MLHKLPLLDLIYIYCDVIIIPKSEKAEVNAI